MSTARKQWCYINMCPYDPIPGHSHGTSHEHMNLPLPQSVMHIQYYIFQVFMKYKLPAALFKLIIFLFNRWPSPFSRHMVRDTHIWKYFS